MKLFQVLRNEPRSLLITIMFFYYASMGVIIPYMPLLLSKSVVTHQIGILMAIGSLIMILMQPVWGWLSDRLGIRLILLITISGTILTTVGLIKANSFFEWVLVISVYFLFQSPIGTLVDTMAITKFTKQFGSIRLWGSIGFGTFVFIGGFLIGTPIYIIHICLLLISLLLSFLLIEPQKSKRKKISAQKSAVIFKNGHLIMILFLLFLTSVSMKGNATFYSIGLTILEVPSWLLGTAWLLQVFPEIGIFLLVDRLAKKSAAWILVIIGMITFAIHFSLLGFYQNLWVWTLTQPLVSLAFCFWYSGSIRLIKKKVPDEYQATGQTLFSAICNGLGGVIGSTFSGFIVSKWNVFGFYTVAGIMCAITAFLFLILNRYGKNEKKDRDESSKLQHTR